MVSIKLFPWQIDPEFLSSVSSTIMNSSGDNTSARSVPVFPVNSCIFFLLLYFPVFFIYSCKFLYFYLCHFAPCREHVVCLEPVSDNSFKKLAINIFNKVLLHSNFRLIYWLFQMIFKALSFITEFLNFSRLSWPDAAKVDEGAGASSNDNVESSYKVDAYWAFQYLNYTMQPVKSNTKR